MEIVLYILALILSVIGIVGAVVPIIPGPALSYIALLIGYFSREDVVSKEWLFIWLVIVVVATVVDYLLPLYLTKKFGGSKSATWGATFGLFVGFIFFPPVGIVLCPFFGAVIGELLNDRNDVEKAFKVGLASFAAFIFGTGLKLIIGLWILFQLIIPLWR
ncbi:MAG: DUF456 domain-containing protein [Rikenellaceae bacterium]